MLIAKRPLTSHCRFVLAFKDMGGKVLTTSQIKGIMLTKFPKMNPGSILPNDHAEGNKSACWCAKTDKRIFDRKDRGVYEVRMNLSPRVPDCQNKRVKLGKSWQRITNLWNPDDKAEWEAALAEYWNYIKPGNLALEKRLNHLNVKKPSDISDWYSFLLNEYIPWKYTAPLYLRNTKDRFSKEYAENHKKLNDIIEELFKFDRNDIRRALDVAGGIKGFGVGGASGLLSLLFPEQFGTVDQFVVKALQKITAFPVGEINSSDIEALRQMKPENLSKSDGIILIRIMRTKADNLNSIFGCRNWTPRKIDMVLWALGHDK